MSKLNLRFENKMLKFPSTLRTDEISINKKQTLFQICQNTYQYKLNYDTKAYCECNCHNLNHMKAKDIPSFHIYDCIEICQTSNEPYKRFIEKQIFKFNYNVHYELLHKMDTDKIVKIERRNIGKKKEKNKVTILYWSKYP